LKNKDSSIKKLISSNVKNIVGTDSYWRDHGIRLREIFREIDEPSGFGTLSSADTYDPKL
jgi:hypothetical protein